MLNLVLLAGNGLILIAEFSLLLMLILFLAGVYAYQKKASGFKNTNQQLQQKIAELEQSITEKNNSLEEQIQQKTKDLLNEIGHSKAAELEKRKALKKAEEANYLKNAFLANMSHEIRTPLNGIVGFSHLLLNEESIREKTDLLEFAKGIAESSDRLLNLMEHIIDLSRIDANDYELKAKEFSVSTVLNSCIERIKPKVYAKNLKLEFTQNQIYKVFGDKAAFEKSIDLILDNAIKYTNEGEVSVWLTPDIKKQQLFVHIKDTGIGIDKNFIPELFEPFRQESTGYSRTQQGAGLGLPLAQKLIHLMKGQIQIESEKGIGTTVALSIPLCTKAQEEGNYKHDSFEESISTTQEPQPQKKRLPNIFIVEDDKMNRMVFEKMLKKRMTILMAEDGDDALKKMHNTIESQIPIDVILLDINLPAPWDGLLLLKELRKTWPLLNQIPCIAQTAYAMSGDREKFLAAGFDDYIAKPIDKKELLTIIENNTRSIKN